MDTRGANSNPTKPRSPPLGDGPLDALDLGDGPLDVLDLGDR
jgi:hypothetical protein